MYSHYTKRMTLFSSIFLGMFSLAHPVHCDVLDEYYCYSNMNHAHPGGEVQRNVGVPIIEVRRPSDRGGWLSFGAADEPPYPEVCSGEWFRAWGIGGADCDNVEVNNSYCNQYDCYCRAIMTNSDSPFVWTVTGFCDRVQTWTYQYYPPDTFCGIESLETLIYIVGTGGGPPETIFLTTYRDEAYSYVDPAPIQERNSQISVYPPELKQRSIGYNADVDYNGWNVLVAFFQSGLWARRDDDKPDWVPGGTNWDEHECTQYWGYIATSNDSQAPVVFDEVLHLESIFPTRPYNIQIYNRIINSNFPGLFINGLGSPGWPIMAFHTQINANYFLHETGHNGGVNDHIADPLNIMGDEASGHFIQPCQHKRWSCQNQAAGTSAPIGANVLCPPIANHSSLTCLPL